MAVVETSAVRSWARDNGYEIGERGRITKEIRDAYEASLDDEPAGISGSWETAPVSTSDAPRETGAEIDRPATAEAKPKRPRLGDKLRSMSRNKLPAAGSKRRVSTEPMLGGVWSSVALGMMMTGADVPVGRLMMIQAPMAGQAMDELVAGSLPDRILLQPLARAGTRGTKAGMLLAPLALVAFIERHPESYDALKPVAKQVMMPMIAELGPAMKAARLKEEKAMESMREAVEELGDAGLEVRNMDDLIDALFAPPPRPVPAAPEDFTPEPGPSSPAAPRGVPDPVEPGRG